MGIRSLEIDVWEDNKLLYVHHGHTRVDKWDLCLAFDVLKNYGFLYTNSPILISVENHIDTGEGLNYFIRCAKKIEE